MVWSTTLWTPPRFPRDSEGTWPAPIALLLRHTVKYDLKTERGRYRLRQMAELLQWLRLCRPGLPRLPQSAALPETRAMSKTPPYEGGAWFRVDFEAVAAEPSLAQRRAGPLPRAARGRRLPAARPRSDRRRWRCRRRRRGHRRRGWRRGFLRQSGGFVSLRSTIAAL